MSSGEFALVGAAVAGAAYLLTRRGAAPVQQRASWDVPSAQRQQAGRIEEAAALYRAGRDADAKMLLRDRVLDWKLIAAAAMAQPLNPTARRIGAAIERDGSGMFLNELQRLAPADRDVALTTLVQALNDYTGAAGQTPGSSS